MPMPPKIILTFYSEMFENNLVLKLSEIVSNNNIFFLNNMQVKI